MGTFLRDGGILDLICLMYTRLSSENMLNSILQKLYVGKLYMPGFLPTRIWDFLFDSNDYLYLIDGATVTGLNFMFLFAIIRNLTHFALSC